MAPLEWLLEIAAGAALGFVSGLFGTGGGVIVIPLLGLFLGYTQQVAQGTAMVMVVSNVFVSLWFYTRRQKIPVLLGVALGAGSLIFTYVAARIALGMDSHLLRRCFAAFLAAVALHLVWRAFAREPGDEERPPILSRRWLLGLSALCGIIGGFFGVGIGAITPPLITGLFGMRQLVAQGLTLAIATPGIVVALATYGWGGVVHWRMGALLALGGMLTVSRGVALAHHLPERWLKAGFGGFLFFSAVALVLTSLR